MNQIATTRVNVIAVGVENYNYMRRLEGPKVDVEGFISLLDSSSSTGLYWPDKIDRLLDPDSNKLRESINNFVINRSDRGDVLIFYFSGHGIPVGNLDFGFCTTDTRFHEIPGSVLPFTVIRFRELVDSLRIMNVIPIIIIDACYSGMVGDALELDPSDAIKLMQREITRQNATNYALFCSCSDRELSIGNKNGGIFSQIIFDVFREGYNTRDPSKSVVFIQDLFHEIKSRTSSFSPNSTPQLFLGETIPSIPLVRNVGFNPRNYKFSPYMAEIVASLWNNGDELEFTKGEILSTNGRGAYGNHRKLSWNVWGLLEDNPVNKKRRLTERGRRFARGEMTIANEVVFDLQNNDYVASPNAFNISIDLILKKD